MNKKATILGWFYIIMILFFLSITVIVSYIIINTASGIDVFTADVEANKAVQITKSTILNFDNLMLFAVVGLSLFVIISAALIYQHPAFFIVSFVLLLTAITFSAVTANTFYDFKSTSTIESAVANFPKMQFLMEKLPFYILFMGMAAAVAGYISFTRAT